MDKIKTVIVEDEPTARETLRSLLEKYCPEVEVVGEGKDINSGLEVIRELKPELVFLDVRMPFGTSFDILKQLMPADFEVIFTTAYDQYALKAIKFSALDYLLKPIDIFELQEAVGKVLDKQAEDPTNLKLESLISNMLEERSRSRRLVVPQATGFEVLNVSDILRCRADGSYTNIFLQSGTKITATKSLREFDELLSDQGFMRVHKSHLINLAYVEKFIRQKNGIIRMKDGSDVELARSRRDEFLSKFLE